MGTLGPKEWPKVLHSDAVWASDAQGAGEDDLPGSGRGFDVCTKVSDDELRALRESKF